MVISRGVMMSSRRPAQSSRVSMWLFRSAVLLGVTTLSLGCRNEEAGASCPPGSDVMTVATGSWCEPSECEVDEGCPDGFVCKQTPLCIRDEVYHPVMPKPGQKPEFKERRVAESKCLEEAHCSPSSTCEYRDRCVPMSIFDLF